MLKKKNTHDSIPFIGEKKIVAICIVLKCEQRWTMTKKITHLYSSYKKKQQHKICYFHYRVFLWISISFFFCFRFLGIMCCLCLWMCRSHCVCVCAMCMVSFFMCLGRWFSGSLSIHQMHCTCTCTCTFYHHIVCSKCFGVQSCLISLRSLLNFVTIYCKTGNCILLLYRYLLLLLLLLMLLLF